MAKKKNKISKKIKGMFIIALGFSIFSLPFIIFNLDISKILQGILGFGSLFLAGVIAIYGFAVYQGEW